VNHLLDEQMHETTARSLDALGNLDGRAFWHILDYRGPGTPDDEIPALCAEIDAQCLVTANVKDFGARKRYYEALLDAGRSCSRVATWKGEVRAFAAGGDRCSQLRTHPAAA
jgi:hypothetical protein